MRCMAKWMQQLDERILEHLAEGPSTPKAIVDWPDFPDVSWSRVRERCRWLAQAGLIAPRGRRSYEITTWGLLYLKGEISAKHQPDPRTVKVGGC